MKNDIQRYSSKNPNDPTDFVYPDAKGPMVFYDDHKVIVDDLNDKIDWLLEQLGILDESWNSL